MTWTWYSPPFSWSTLAAMFAAYGCKGMRVWLQANITIGAEDPSQGNGCIVVGWQIFCDGLNGPKSGETNVTTYQQHPLPALVGHTVYVRIYYSC